MKRVYKTPKAVLVDFCYDEQVVADSSGGVASHGDPNHIGRCQQTSEKTCVHFWNDIIGGICKAEPFSLRGFPVA